MFTAIARSLKTVKLKVINRMATSALGARLTMRLKCFNSLMLYATTNKIAANAHSGMSEAKGAKKKISKIKVTACAKPAMGLLPPLRILVAVRAIAPVAAKPPNRGVTRLAMPCPTNS
ncbi:hypothetical protein D9M71_592820 [compost metagenome]